LKTALKKINFLRVSNNFLFKIGGAFVAARTRKNYAGLY
jgi:hypothetical protein